MEKCYGSKDLNDIMLWLYNNRQRPTRICINILYSQIPPYYTMNWLIKFRSIVSSLIHLMFILKMIKIHITLVNPLLYKIQKYRYIGVVYNQYNDKINIFHSNTNTPNLQWLVVENNNFLRLFSAHSGYARSTSRKYPGSIYNPDARRVNSFHPEARLSQQLSSPRTRQEKALT